MLVALCRSGEGARELKPPTHDVGVGIIRRILHVIIHVDIQRLHFIALLFPTAINIGRSTERAHYTYETLLNEEWMSIVKAICDVFHSCTLVNDVVDGAVRNERRIVVKVGPLSGAEHINTRSVKTRKMDATEFSRSTVFGCRPAARGSGHVLGRPEVVRVEGEHRIRPREGDIM